MIIFCFKKKTWRIKKMADYCICYAFEVNLSLRENTHIKHQFSVYSEKSFHKLKAPRWPALSSEARPSSEHDPEPLSCSLQSVPLPTPKGKQNPNIKTMHLFGQLFHFASCVNRIMQCCV